MPSNSLHLRRLTRRKVSSQTFLETIIKEHFRPECSNR
jgi:hypothetical protein